MCPTLLRLRAWKVSDAGAGIPHDTAQGAGATAGPHRTVLEFLTGFEDLEISAALCIVLHSLCVQ